MNKIYKKNNGKFEQTKFGQAVLVKCVLYPLASERFNYAGLSPHFSRGTLPTFAALSPYKTAKYELLFRQHFFLASSTKNWENSLRDRAEWADRRALLKSLKVLRSIKFYTKNCMSTIKIIYNRRFSGDAIGSIKLNYPSRLRLIKSFELLISINTELRNIKTNFLE